MKLYILLIFFLTSCSFYSNYKDIRLTGLGPGKVIISSSVFYQEIFINDEEGLIIEIEKGYDYAVSFYPNLGGELSRYPSGNIIFKEDNLVNMHDNYGPLALELHSLNKFGYDLDIERVNLLQEMLNTTNDPWLYYGSDISLYLQDIITINGIRSKRIFNIPDLDKYKLWKSENPCFENWYMSVQMFYNNEDSRIFRVEILQDGKFYGFIDVN